MERASSSKRKTRRASRSSSTRKNVPYRLQMQKIKRQSAFALQRNPPPPPNISMDIDRLIKKMNYIEMEIDNSMSELADASEINNMILQNTSNNSRSAIWYNYRIGMNPGHYMPLFSLTQHNTKNTFPIIDFFSNIPAPEQKSSYTRRFFEIFFEKNQDGSIQMNIMNTNNRRYNDRKLDTDLQLWHIEEIGGQTIIQEIYNYVFEQIRELNLIETILNTINHGEKLFITIDFYFNRTGNIQFHKDAILEDSETLYVALTYNNEYSMLGPDIIAYPSNPAYRASPVINTSRQHKKLEVFRTLIPPYGRIGFNDQIFAHSSPYENNELFTEAGIEICRDVANMCQRVKLEKSPYRGTMVDKTPRTFLRTWWYHYKPGFDNWSAHGAIKKNIWASQKIDFNVFTELCNPMSNIADYIYDYKMITKDLFKGIVRDLNREMVNL